MLRASLAASKAAGLRLVASAPSLSAAAPHWTTEIQDALNAGRAEAKARASEEKASRSLAVDQDGFPGIEATEATPYKPFRDATQLPMNQGDSGFTDRTRIRVMAGKGGNGSLANKASKNRVRGRPDGGHAGDGGDVFIETFEEDLHGIGSAGSRPAPKGSIVHSCSSSSSLDGLPRNLRGTEGGSGRHHGMDGAKGRDVVLRVPAGTVLTAYSAATGKQQKVDLDSPHMRLRIARGGHGGRGSIGSDMGLTNYRTVLRKLAQKARRDARKERRIAAWDSMQERKAELESLQEAGEEIPEHLLDPVMNRAAASGDMDMLKKFSKMSPEQRFWAEFGHGGSEGNAARPDEWDLYETPLYRGEQKVKSLLKESHRVRFLGKVEEAEELENEAKELEEKIESGEITMEDVEGAAGGEYADPYSKALQVVEDMENEGLKADEAAGQEARDTAPEYEEWLKARASGTPGEDVIISLTLKTIADVSLIGFPNAGKSSLLTRVSGARPRIASYPFTTLRPNLGSVEFAKDCAGVTVADIPGLIGGAAENVGLGHSFLRHVERTRVLCYVVDVSPAGVAGANGCSPYDTFRTLQAELDRYHPGLTSRPSLIIANKLDESGAVENAKDFLGELNSHFTAMKSGDNLPEYKAADEVVTGENHGDSPPPSSTLDLDLAVASSTYSKEEAAELAEMELEDFVNGLPDGLVSKETELSKEVLSMVTVDDVPDVVPSHLQPLGSPLILSAGDPPGAPVSRYGAVKTHLPDSHILRDNSAVFFAMSCAESREETISTLKHSLRYLTISNSL